MEIRIVTLSENTASHDYPGEWGLSILVEADGKQILFDTGAGLAAVNNANLMGIDLAAVDSIVLSHGHQDHTGGLREVLRVAGNKEIVAHPDIWALKYARWKDRPEHFGGIHFRRELLESLGARFNLSREPVKLSGHIMTTGEIPMVNDYETVDEHLLVKEDGEFKPDSLNDDLAMIIDTEYGLVVILGCAHRGIVNTLQHAKKCTGKDLIYTAIGGTHLVHAPEERLEKTAAALLEMGVQYLGASHCTGFKAAAYLAQAFGERFFLNNSGTRLTLPFREG